MPIAWSVVIYIIFYNLGDVIGKFIGSFKDVFNKQSLIYIFLCRLLFYIPVTILAKGEDK